SGSSPAASARWGPGRRRRPSRGPARELREITRRIRGVRCSLPRFLPEGKAMWGQTKQAASATTALVYITLGALTGVWSAVYYVYLTRNADAGDNSYLWCAGFFFSGLVLIG